MLNHHSNSKLHERHGKNLKSMRMLVILKLYIKIQNLNNALYDKIKRFLIMKSSRNNKA
jgi:hypothetical protein